MKARLPIYLFDINKNFSNLFFSVFVFFVLFCFFFHCLSGKSILGPSWAVRTGDQKKFIKVTRHAKQITKQEIKNEHWRINRKSLIFSIDSYECAFIRRKIIIFPVKPSFVKEPRTFVKLIFKLMRQRRVEWSLG